MNYKQLCGFLVCCLLLCGCSGSRLLQAGSPLHGDQHWHGTVLIDGDVTLADDAVLHIAPGTQILFLPPSAQRDLYSDHPHFPGSELIVQGRIVAEGTAQQPIVFAYVDPAAAAGSWGGINLSESPEARFRYCRFTQADSALHSQAAQVSVEDSLFEKNRVAIRFHSSNIRIEHNLLRTNGTAIRFHFGTPAIRYNELFSNDKAFFLSSAPGKFLITANNIVATNGDTVVLGEEVATPVALSGNWWGTNDPAAIAAGFFDAQRDAYLGRVEFVPVADAPISGAGIR